MRLMAPSDDSLILWNVVEEHLDEAGFCLGVWRESLSSPLYTLEEVAQGPEERLRAHIDGLVIAGAPAVERLLIPKLMDQAEEEPESAVIAAVCLAWLGRAEVLMEALDSVDPLIREACREGLALYAPASFDAHLMARLPLLAPGVLRAELTELALRRGLPIEHLTQLLRSELPSELVVGLKAARQAGGGGWRGPVEALLAHEHPQVHQEAVISGVCLGSTTAWAHALLDTRRPIPCVGSAQLVALFGDPTEHAPLLAMLEDASRRLFSLRLLGLTGRPDLAPHLLELLDADDLGVRRQAGEALSWITGLNLQDDPYNSAAPDDEDGLPDLDEDDLDAPVVLDPDDDLPIPAAEAIRRWWGSQGRWLTHGSRALCGEVWDTAQVLHQLREGPNHRRASLALWLEVQSGGRARISTGAWTRRQLQQLDDVASLPNVPPLTTRPLA